MGRPDPIQSRAKPPRPGEQKNRGARIRTGDLRHPKAARYQAAPRPAQNAKSIRGARRSDMCPRDESDRGLQPTKTETDVAKPKSSISCRSSDSPLSQPSP